MNSQFADGNDESDDTYIEEDEESLYENLDTLEKLETIISLMEELHIATLQEAKEHYASLEASIESDDVSEIHEEE